MGKHMGHVNSPSWTADFAAFLGIPQPSYCTGLSETSALSVSLGFRTSLAWWHRVATHYSLHHPSASLLICSVTPSRSSPRAREKKLLRGQVKSLQRTYKTGFGPDMHGILSTHLCWKHGQSSNPKLRRCPRFNCGLTLWLTLRVEAPRLRPRIGGLRSLQKWTPPREIFMFETLLPMQ